jgi:hypothetical protein
MNRNGGRRITDRRAAAGDASGPTLPGIDSRLLALIDQAPLEALPLPGRTLARARTLGYNLIGQVRCIDARALTAEFGSDEAALLIAALVTVGVRWQGQAAADATQPDA